MKFVLEQLIFYIPVQFLSVQSGINLTYIMFLCLNCNIISYRQNKSIIWISWVCIKIINAIFFLDYIFRYMVLYSRVVPPGIFFVYFSFKYEWIMNIVTSYNVSIVKNARVFINLFSHISHFYDFTFTSS